jgi:von Willebrand factor type A C-terminal domain
VRRIAQALLGTVDIVGEPSQLRAEFAGLMQASMARGIAAADLRVWTPQGAQLLFVRQVSPSVEDLTARRTDVNALTGAYPTGSWGDESRDYHVAVRVPAKTLGQEQLAARVQLAVGPDVVAQSLVKAKWSDDEGLTTRINPEVAHYTGQTELADAIQEGLAAKAAGDEATATTRLGRAVQLAEATGNAEATTRLRKVVDIDDPGTGTVRLRRDVQKADEMALDTGSTKTTRIRS